jgi:crotonobetainyl-CoA:carnitine CoA-transferase CaiB-like acyl-CoA transferase
MRGTWCHDERAVPPAWLARVRCGGSSPHAGDKVSRRARPPPALARARPARRRIRRPARGHPRIVVCSITGYGQERAAARSGGARHELPRRERAARPLGRAGRVPAQSAAQIADLGGGALMAACGILAALRECDGSGEGQHVVVSMTGGALSWLAVVAGAPPRRRQRAGLAAGTSWRAASSATARTPAPTAPGSRSARSSRAFWSALCTRRRSRGSRRAAVRRARQRRPRRGGARGRNGSAFVRTHECCLDPVLELDESLSSELVAARGGRRARPAGRARARAPARRAGEALAHAAGHGPAAGPRARRAHRGCPARRRLRRRADRRAAALGRGRRTTFGAGGSFLG